MATISSGSLKLGGISGAGTCTLNSTVPFLNGRPKLLVDVTQGNSSITCSVILKAQPYPSGTVVTSTLNFPAATGIQTFNFPVSVKSPMNLTQVKFSCGSGTLARTVDWLSIQNGTTPWAPGDDINLSWSDTQLPAGGSNNVVISAGADGLYTASDVGGVAWYDPDSQEWASLNGVGVDLYEAPDDAVWDVLPLDLDSDGSVDTMYALTGNWYNPTLFGGLWKSTDGGGSWSNLGLSDIAGYGRIHACNINDDGLESGDGHEPARAGGHLMAWDAVHSWLYTASHQTGHEGVWLVDSGGTATQIDSTDLPTGYVSSLLLVDDGSDEDGTIQQLLVGYKGDTERGVTLYLCGVPSGAVGAGSITCAATTGWPESGGIDVRDLQWDNADPADRTVFVADAQRFNSSGTCTTNNGEAWLWDLDTDTLTDVTESLAAAPDSDDPNDKELVGLTMDEEGSYLYGFFPGGQDMPYVYPKVWRIAEAAADGSGSDWEPLSDTDDATRTANTHSLAYVSDPDTWLDDQPDRASWAPAFGVDGIFYEDAHTSTERMAVADGFGTWLVDGAADAWSDVDNDVVWTQAYSSANGGGTLPQATVAHDVAVTGDGIVWSALSDLGASDWDPGGARGSEVQCIWDKFNAVGDAVDTPGAGGSGEQIWLALGDSPGGESINTGIFYSADGGADWCYESTENLSSSALISGSDGLHVGCKENSMPTAPCDASHNDKLKNSSGTPLGIPTDIVGLNMTHWPDGEGVAVATFKVNAPDSGALVFTTDAGASWTEVTGAPSDFYDVKAHIVVDPVGTTYSSSTDYTISLFLGGESNSGYGGVEHVTWSHGDCSGSSCTGAWTAIATSGHGCHIDGNNLSGIAANPWFSYSPTNERLWVWGGLTRVSSTWWGGVCSVNIADDTDQVEVVAPGAGHYYDIASVLPVPDMDRTLFIQPAVNAVTESVCADGSETCTRPDPFVDESLRPLGGTYTWTPTTLSTDGLESLRGDGLAMDWNSGPPLLYYVTSGTGVQTTEVAW